MTEAGNLIAGLKPGHVIGDKGYDSDPLRHQIRAQGGRPVIPSRHKHRRRRCPKDKYRERNVIERFFGKVKHFRRVATRYDKLDPNYFGWLCLASFIVETR